MDRRLRWGVLGAAPSRSRRSCPACSGAAPAVVALASRDRAKGEAAARALGIARVHGSYEELLADPDVDAVYNPLPNHLHVPWSIRALEAGKHVLCEKPIGLSAAEVEELLRARDRTGRQVQEAFMVRTHPQWLGARELVRSGRIGTLRAVMTFFSYFNETPRTCATCRSTAAAALFDIGCYPITISRFLFGAEPVRVAGCLELDPRSAPTGSPPACWSSRRASRSSRAARRRAVPARPGDRHAGAGSRSRSRSTRRPTSPARVRGRRERPAARRHRDDRVRDCDQYTIQGDLFSRAILEGTPVPIPLEDALGNARVIAAVFRSAESGRWESALAKA